MKKLMLIAAAAAALMVTPVLAANPHCAGNSDNYKHPVHHTVQNHPACD